MSALVEIPFTHRRILKIAIPVVLSNATVPILGAVDTGVVGQLGAAAPIGAVGIGAIILTAIYWIFGFLRMGTAGLTAQAIGARDQGEITALLVRGLMIGGVVGLFFILFQMPVFWAAFQVSPASAEVEGLAREYLSIRVFSAPAAISIYAVTGWMVAHERTFHVLILQFWMNGLNILLDLLFVLHFDWGVQGVASATLIAEWSGLILALWLVRDGFSAQHWNNWPSIFDPVRLKRMAWVNGDIMLRSIMLQIGFVSFLFYGAAFGDVVLAANQVLLQFLYITAYALDGFAFAAEALVGQSLGARNRAALRRAVMLNGLWALLTVAILASAFAGFGGWLIAVMAKSEAVQQAAGDYLFWMVLAPIMGGAAWLLDGVFIGATRTADMRNMMFISLCAYFLAIWLLLERFGNHGLWAALLIMFVVRGVTLALRYPSLEAEADT